MLRLVKSHRSAFRGLVLAGVTAMLLAGCAANRVSQEGPDFSGMSYTQTQQALADLGARYKARPNDKHVAISYAAALRAAGQSAQAVAVIEQLMSAYGNDADVRVAYAKSLSADGRFDQALRVLDETIRPEAPDWNALSVKGAVLDQMGRHDEARQLYAQALLIAPGQASIAANLGLSYAMTGDLGAAELELRKAVQMRGANSQVRQNLALVIGLQGRFDEARAIYSAELPPDQVESNMAYIRALLTQQNRWQMIKDSK